MNDEEMMIRNKKCKIPKGTPIMCLIGRANRDESIFDKESINEINPNQETLDKIISWNGIEKYIENQNGWKKVPRYDCYDVMLMLLVCLL